VLVERDRELAALDALLDRGGALMIEGGAGIGKTALAAEAAAAARQRGWRVLRGCGTELETGFAFGVVRQLLERMLAEASPEQRSGLLAGPAYPVAGLLAGPPGQAGELAAQDASFAIRHGLYWLIVHLAAGQPVLIIVDDAHWADEPSLRWLAYLAIRLDGLGAALLVALRPAEAASRAGPLLAVRSAAALPAMTHAASQAGSARGLIAVHSAAGLLHLRLGALPEADGAARVAVAVLRDGDFAAGLGVAAVAADIATESGQLDEADALLDLIPPGPPGVISVLVPAARGRLRLARGDGPRALACFEACLAMLHPDVWGIGVREAGYLHARSGAAQALLLTGDQDRARALAQAELADAREFGGRRALGVALRAAGLAQDQAGGGLALLAESADVLRGSPARLERARSLTELGAALRRAGQRTAARPLLAEALDLASRCGARPLAGRAHDELIAAGGRPRRERQYGTAALTPSELRVARLAADGRTNREIARGLYVTPKTVETHLAHAYAKLGITGRAGLAAALAGESSGCPPRGEQEGAGRTVGSSD
jgi:DNA-binding CsgD family transcriptional regulator